jgi:hypothetical protein
MKLFLHWFVIFILLLYAVSPLGITLWAWWLFFYDPPHDQTIRFLIGCVFVFFPILSGPVLLLVRYLWPRR